MWKPKKKKKKKDLTITYPVACEVKYDGEWVYWNGQKLVNKRGVPKTTITKLPSKELYGELYYGEGKEFYSEIHSHANYKNEVILFDTGDYGMKPYLKRRSYLEELSTGGYKIVPIKICDNEKQMHDFFERTIAQGYEGIVAKPLDSLTDQSWFKMKREYTATLKIRGLRKDKTIPTATMGTDDHIYCSVSLNGWNIIIDMLNKEKLERGIDQWITGQDSENYFINSNITLELKHNGVIKPSNKLRHPRVNQHTARRLK